MGGFLGGGTSSGGVSGGVTGSGASSGSVSGVASGGSGSGTVVVTLDRSRQTRAEAGVRAQAAPGEPNLNQPQRIVVNTPEYDAVGYQDSGTGTLLGYIRGSATYDDFYFRGGVRLGTIQGDTGAAIDEAIVHYRNPALGDLVVGRFHWFPGPVSNTSLGRLISFYTGDGVLYQAPQLGPFHLEGAYFLRVDPLNGTQAATGGAARVETTIRSFRIGATAFTSSTASNRVGESADATFPVVANVLDVYGEVGHDPFQEDFFTGGFYFPILLRLTGSDVYVEYARRTGYGGLVSGSAQFPVYKGIHGLLTLSKFDTGNWQPGFGVLARY